MESANIFQPPAHVKPSDGRVKPPPGHVKPPPGHMKPRGGHVKTREILIRLQRSAFDPHPHWDKVDAGGYPLRRCWVGPIDELSNALGFLPLSPATIFITLSFLSVGIFNVYSTSRQPLQWTSIGDYSMGIIKIIFSSCGLLGCLFRWATGLTIMLIGYNIFLCTSTVSCLIRWIEWIVAIIYTGWIPTSHDIMFITLHISIYVFLMLTPLWLIGILHSLRMVISVGGNGWENQNYLELRWKLDRQIKGADKTEITVGRFAAAHLHPTHKIKNATKQSNNTTINNQNSIDTSILLPDNIENLTLKKHPLITKINIAEVVPRIVTPSHKFDESRQIPGGAANNVSEITKPSAILEKHESLWTSEGT